jgi:AsmA family protein
MTNLSVVEPCSIGWEDEVPWCSAPEETDVARWLIYSFLALLGLLLVAIAAVYLLIGHFNLASLASSRASAALGRQVTIDALHITPGRWITIEVDAARLANVPGGSRPVMVELRHLTTEVDALSLLHRPLIVRRLVVDGLSILAERTADHTPNWKLGAAKPKPSTSDNRSWFPTLLDARLHDSEVVYRTSGGATFRTTLNNLSIVTPSASQSVRLTATGSYNGTPVSLLGELQSIEALRDGAVPYGMELHLRSDETRFSFKGTMTDPLDVDGAEGAVVLEAPTPKSLLALAGLTNKSDLSLQLAGQLRRQGDLWSLTGAAGELKGNPITAASLQLKEGSKGKPDELATDIAFSRLDLNGLLRGGSGAGASDADIPLDVARSPDPLIDAHLSARQLTYNGIRGSAVSLSAAITPGQIVIRALALTYLGASIRAEGRLDAADKIGRVSAKVVVSGADIQQLRHLLGLGSVPLSGKLDAQLVASSSGATLNGAARAADVVAAVSMSGGSIARYVIEMASTDIRSLFRKAKGTTTVACLLGVLNMNAGVGTISPLRIRAASGTVVGEAQFDLYRRTFDLTIGSQPASTGIFALDIPIRVYGTFASPTVRPAKWPPASRARLAAATTVTKLPPSLQQLVSRNPCLRAQAGRR